MRMKRVWICAAGLGLLGTIFSPGSRAEQVKKPFTVADDIGLTLMEGSEDLHFSPDGSYFALVARRGRLDNNHVEESLRFYSSRDVQKFLEGPDGTQPPAPVWLITKTDSSGFDGLRWLADSSAVIFLEHLAEGKQRLVFADPRKKTIEPLTTALVGIKTFDVRDAHNFVYSVKDPAPVEKMHEESRAAAFDATGRSLYSLLFPDNPAIEALSSNRSHLRAVVGGKPFEVKHDGAAIIHTEELALSPDATSVVTTLPIAEIPPSWEALYQPPYPSATGVHSGKQNMDLGLFSARRYVRITLQTGAIEVLMDSPLPWQANWGDSGYYPSWSRNGKEILLPAAFPVSKGNGPVRPCVAVVSLPSDSPNCVLTWAQIRKDLEGVWVRDARFAEGDASGIVVTFIVIKDGKRLVEKTEYRRGNDGAWQAWGPAQERNLDEGLKVTVKQGFNDPPLLAASNDKVSRVIWDPNPQLKNLDMGQASIYTWKDGEGKERRALLFKPSDYKPGRRYPLVIQTHGFSETEFRPSGGLTTGYAAREMAAAGIIVLQVQDVGSCGDGAPDEGPCNAAGFETVAKQLVSEGLADAENIGLSGFSATVHHVMQALTTMSSIHYRASLITDGRMAGYLQYMYAVDLRGNGLMQEFDAQIGAPPFGEGLQVWLRRSPTFNLDKVETPLMVVAEGHNDLLFMWEPYAGLRYLQKPVDLVLLNTTEHALSNPAMRMASQGGAVDWYRFWLQGYEDPNPAKAEQYERWRELRSMQEKNRQQAKTKAGLCGALRGKLSKEFKRPINVRRREKNISSEAEALHLLRFNVGAKAPNL